MTLILFQIAGGGGQVTVQKQKKKKYSGFSYFADKIDHPLG